MGKDISNKSLKDVFKPLNFDEKEEVQKESMESEVNSNELINTSIKLPKWMIEKMRDYNYWNAIPSYDEFALEVFENFFKNTQVKSRPDEVKERERKLQERKMKTRRKRKKT